MNIDLHPLDLAILAAYFLIVAFLGVVVGKKKTKNLSDFFIAGGKWGPVVAFIFVFASVVGGAEAVVVAGASYESGLSGIWYWWSGLFGIIIYYLFAPIYKRSRVLNPAEFLEMRYGANVATVYALLVIVLILGNVGLFALAGGKVIAGLTGLSVEQTVIISGVVVAAYIGSGGMMSSLFTDMFQGVMTLTAFCFLLLPFLWQAADGFEGLRQLPPEYWSLQSKQLPARDIFALIFASTFGAVVQPILFSLIVVGKDERAATQCGWGHLWKRTITILFAVYGLLFFLYNPNLADPEQAWGIVMKELLPTGLLGLLIASFFAALMSSVDTISTSNVAIIVDYLFRKRLLPRRSTDFYLLAARIISVVVVILSCWIALQFDNLQVFIKFFTPFGLIIAIPFFFGIIWRRTNRQGVWATFGMGMVTYFICQLLTTYTNANYLSYSITDIPTWVSFWKDNTFVITVIAPAIVSLVAIYFVSILTRPESDVLLNRFYCILNTPLGEDNRLKAVGIRLPMMEKEGESKELNFEEEIDAIRLEDLYNSYTAYKLCGPGSSIETLVEPNLNWYYRGALWLTACCIFLIVSLWLAARVMAYLSLG